MNKLYIATTTKTFFRTLMLTIFLAGMAAVSKAQIAVTATAGTATGTYTTLKGAFDAINLGTHQGIINISINGNTTETATAVLNSSNTPSNYSSVIIKPTGAYTIQGNIAGALIKLYGADNVVIDGAISGITRDLTIRNTSTSTSAIGIWLGSVSASNGAVDNIIMNTKISMAGTSTYCGIMQSSGTTPGAVSEGPNSNNLYANNEITYCYYGIALVGNGTTLDVENSITNNIIGSTSASGYIGYKGMHVANQNNVLIANNIITGINCNYLSTTAGNQANGIYIIGAITNGVIEKNKISNININGIYGAAGIQLQSSTPNTGLVVVNNFIWDIRNNGYATLNTVDDNPMGIAIQAGGGYKIYYNSISINTPNNNSVATGRSTALFLSNQANITGLDIRNNIFSNTASVGVNFTVADMGNPVNQVDISNYNNYYSSTNTFALVGTVIHNDLAAWQALALQDANSVSVNPFYVSATDLHLAPNSPLDALGTPIAGQGFDIDNQARNATTPDIGADEFTPPNCTSATDAGTVTASTTEICGSGSAILSSTGYSYGLGTTYQWQWSNSVGGPWTNMTGQTNPLNGNTGTLTADRYFRLEVRCNGNNPATSNVIHIQVYNPVVASTTPGTRCGVGTVDLGATAASGIIRWYDAPTGGTPLATGTTFTTPVINTTTNYYAALADGGVIVTGGKPTWSYTGAGYTGSGGIIFDAYQNMTIESVRIFPEANGTIDVAVMDPGGNILPGCSQSFTVTANTTTGVLLNLNFNVPPGTDYRLVRTNSGIAIKRDFSPNSFPYDLSPAGAITSNVLGAPGNPNGNTYYYFYDWTVSTACEGVRTLVTATVTAPPAMNITPAAGPGRTICSGNSITLTASSAASPAYSYSWEPGSLTGASINVTPTTTTTYTVTADNGSCVNVEEVTVIVNNTPEPITITPPTASICANAVLTVTANGGLIPNQIFLDEDCDTYPLSDFVTFGSGVTAAQRTDYFAEGTGSVHLTYGNNALGGIQMNSSINLTGTQNPILKFSHIAAMEGTFTNPWDKAYLEYSINGGGTWTTVPASWYLGSGTLVGGTVTFIRASYPDWNSHFTSSAVTNPGPAPATSMWKEEMIDLSGLPTMNNVRFRFVIDSDGSVLYNGWYIDDISISATSQAPVTWAPVTNLYLDAAHTTAYAGEETSVVYYYTTGTTAPLVYTATATGGVGCVQTATTTLSSTVADPSVSITGPSTFCGNEPVTLNAIPVNGGANAAYRWLINGSYHPLQPMAHADYISYTFAPGFLQNGDHVTVQMVAAGVAPCPQVNVISDTFTVTVHDAPDLSITGNNEVCLGDPSLLTANDANATTISTYHWQLNGGNVGTNSSTYSASLPGDYTVIATNDNGCTDTSGVFVVTHPDVNIDVLAGPNGTITPAGPVHIVPCGTDVTFTITPNPGYSIIDVIYTDVDTGLPGSLGAVTTYTAINPKDGDMIEAYFGIVGCPNPPTAHAGYNTQICPGETYAVSVGSPTIGGSATAGTWSTSGTGTFNSTTYSIANTNIYTPSEQDILNGSVDITLTTNNPLGGSCIASASTITITFKEVPDVTISGFNGICTNGNVTTTLTGSATFSGTITGYQWYRDATPLGTSTTEIANTAANYILQANGNNGCSGRDTLAVSVLTPPTVTLSGDPYFCVNASTELSALGTAGSGTIGANSYQWFLGVNPIPGAVTATYFADAPGSYTAIVTNSDGCISDPSNAIVAAYDNSPMVGTYTVGLGPANCTNFETIERAVTALNTRGIGGDCIIEVVDGFIEVAPVGGLVLGSATLNSSIGANTITFQKSGAGANPQIVAYTGTNTNNSNTPDGIWSLVGVNNVTITDFDLVEDPDNEVGNEAQIFNKTMEYGFGLFKRNNIDGCQNNTIMNCNISLSRLNYRPQGEPMFNGSVGIFSTNALFGAALTQPSFSNSNGGNSNNTFTANHISNVNIGIGLNGYPFASAPFTYGDTGNTIGGSNSTDGNTIVDFGGATSIIGNNTYGVHIRNQYGVTVSNNTIRNNSGTGADALSNISGIKAEGGTNAGATISFNEIELTTGNVTGLVTVYGIEQAMGGSGTNNTVQIINNNITADLNSTNANSKLVGVFTANASGPYNLVINNNVIHDLEHNVNQGTAGFFAGIRSENTGVNSLSISNNTINNLVAQSTQATNLTSHSFTGIYAAGYSNGTINNNDISNLQVTNAVANNHYFSGIFNAGFGSNPSAVVINNNTISDLELTLTGSFYGGPGGIFSVNTAITTEEIQGNHISNLAIIGTSSNVSNLYGMFCNGHQSFTNRLIAQNTITNLYSAAGISSNVYGISSSTSLSAVISRNHISKLFAGKSTHTNQVIRGIWATGNSADNTLSNNMISLDLTQAVSPAAGNVLEGAASVYGIDFSNANAAFVNKLYYNTVRLAGSGAGNFGSAALYCNSNGPALTMNNNILVNEMTPSGSGHCNAMRVNPATYPSIQTTSNNNLFYTTQTANTALLRRFTTINLVTLADLKANVNPRETNSVDALPVFVDVANNDLHLDGDDNCMIAGLGTPVAGITIDFDNDARDAVQPDIGADEFINNGGAPYTWAGVNTDWEDAVNWCSGVPQADHDVIIPSGLTNYPILTTNTNEVGSVTIESGATVTLNAGAVLTVHGEDFEINGTLVNNGMLSFAGSVAQTFGTGSGNITAMNDIEFNNAAGLTIARDLDIYGELRPTDGNFILDNVDVTLRSTPTGSAFVSEVQSGAGFVYAGTGKFIVENYMATSGNEGWRFLSIPTNTVQTVNGAWMEGQTPGSYTATGYGTQIVGPSSAGAGFDANTYTTGMKTFDPSTNTWISIPGTGGAINNDNGYMIFVRGDRGSNTYGNSSNTILRTQGPIKTGQLTVTHPNATEFVSVGNPYPSAINFGLVSRTNVANRFYIWDPKLGTYGAYQTFNYVGGVYIPTPGGGSYASNANIESGQAFLIETTAANAQLVIEENDKAYGSNPVTRPLNTYALIRTNLYTVADGAPHLMDGVLNMYDAEFSNDLNSDDATKAGNFNESFGILNSDKILSVELREAVAVTDTIQYSMGAMKLNTPYRLTVTVQNLLVPDNAQAWLEDRFAGTLTPLGFDNDTDYDFTVSNAAGSYAADRFRIVFQRAAAPVPVRFTRIEATPNGKDVLVKWEVSNEVNIETYTVQRSTDGRNFSDVGEVNATGISGYHHTDVEPGTGVFYYRVRSNGIQAGDVLYSSIVSVVLAEQGGFITVYPNPVQDDRVVKIDIQGMEAGKFEARLLSTDGREVLKKVLYHPGGNAVHELRLSARMPRGIYTLMIKNSNTKTAVKIVY